MKRIISLSLFATLLSSCNGWILQPQPGPTPFLPWTPTPSVYTATPVVINPNTSTPIITTFTPAIIATDTFLPTDSATLPPSPTFTPGSPAITIIVLGCNTSIDLTHGMGEVTNAFVTLKNTGGIDLTNIKTTLYARDEGRIHPDKMVELPILPAGYQATIKLTVDSTYKQETPIQVEVTSDQGTFPREGQASCTDIGLFAPGLDTLNTPAPSSP